MDGLEIEFAERMLPPGGPFGTAVYVCNVCGGVVFDIDQHEEWHERTEAAL